MLSKSDLSTGKLCGGDLYITTTSTRNFSKNFIFKEKDLLLKSR